MYAGCFQSLEPGLRKGDSDHQLCGLGCKTSPPKPLEDEPTAIANAFLDHCEAYFADDFVGTHIHNRKEILAPLFGMLLSDRIAQIGFAFRKRLRQPRHKRSNGRIRLPFVVSRQIGFNVLTDLDTLNVDA